MKGSSLGGRIKRIATLFYYIREKSLLRARNKDEIFTLFSLSLPLFFGKQIFGKQIFGKQKSNIFQLRAFQKKKEKTTTNSPLFSFGEVISPLWEAPVSSLDYPATETRHG